MSKRTKAWGFVGVLTLVTMVCSLKVNYICPVCQRHDYPALQEYVPGFLVSHYGMTLQRSKHVAVHAHCEPDCKMTWNNMEYGVNNTTELSLRRDNRFYP